MLAPAPEPPAERAPEFRNEWAPPLSPEITYGEKCGEYNLCAYRREGYKGRHDFRAPESNSGDVCYSFPPGDEGFVAVVNGRRYGIYV